MQWWYNTLGCKNAHHSLLSGKTLIKEDIFHNSLAYFHGSFCIFVLLDLIIITQIKWQTFYAVQSVSRLLEHLPPANTLSDRQTNKKCLGSHAGPHAKICLSVIGSKWSNEEPWGRPQRCLWRHCVHDGTIRNNNNKCPKGLMVCVFVSAHMVKHIPIFYCVQASTVCCISTGRPPPTPQVQ